MTFDEYQKKAHRTSKNTLIGNDALLYPVLGMGDEVGEVLGKLKKVYRDKNGIFDADERIAVSRELGDVLWYFAEICTQMGVSMASVAGMNLAKLEDRAERDVIGGSGDER